MDTETSKKHVFRFVPCIMQEILFEPIPTYWLIRRDRAPERVREYVTPKNHATIYVGEYGHIYKYYYGRMIEMYVQKGRRGKDRHLAGQIPEINAKTSRMNKPRNEHISLNILVASCWCHNPNSATHTQVDHLDSNRLNNVATNLQWVTPAENYRRYYFNYHMLKLANRMNTLRKVIY